MLILGLNAYHGDSAACLVEDGKLICAIEEERIRRLKHWAGLPTESIKWCLDYSGNKISDIDYIAISRNPSAHLHKKILRLFLNTPRFNFLKGRLQNVSKVKDLKTSIAQELGINGTELRAKLMNVEHHRAHLASSFLVSPFDKAVSISVDGFGDFLSAMRGVGEGNQIVIKDWVEFPHSLGIFYTAFTQYLGFPKYGDEYKVMGLSAYGKPSHLDKMREIVKLKDNGLFELDTSYFLHDKEGVDMIWENGEPELGTIYSDKVKELFGDSRNKDEEITSHHQDLASSVQAMYEEAFFHILNDMYDKSKIDKITLSGGCIQNSLANGKIYSKTPYREVYIPSASYDAGTAIGAAYWVWNVLLNNERNYVMESPFLGPEYSDNDIESLLSNSKIKYELYNNDRLLHCTAKAISEGKIVGWFQGKTEWGPRALGNRSILVDPRSSKMKDILNERIKRREGFRPFAPSILQDFVSEWFDEYHSVNFMEKVYKVKANKRDSIPAIVHIDGTGRLQTVTKEINPKYYSLIEEFYKITNVPIVLNTSFNEREPIVNTPDEAIDCFQRTRMDVLVLGNLYINSSRI